MAKKRTVTVFAIERANKRIEKMNNSEVRIYARKNPIYINEAKINQIFTSIKDKIECK